MTKEVKGRSKPLGAQTTESERKSRRRGAELDPEVVKVLGDALQSYYRTLADEPLPDRFKVMLAELEAEERRRDN
jgi:hypothetical protein